MTQGDLIIVFWHDTIDDNSWQPLELCNIMQPILVKSVGFFLSEDASCIRIITSITHDNEASIIVVPKGAIAHIEQVREDELDVDFCSQAD